MTRIADTFGEDNDDTDEDMIIEHDTNPLETLGRTAECHLSDRLD